MSALAVCVDRGTLADGVVMHSRAVAAATGATATLLSVLELDHGAAACPDPIGWGLRRRETLRTLDRIARRCSGTGDHLSAEVVEGEAAEQICRWARDHDIDLIVLGAGPVGPSGSRRLGGTVCEVVERLPVSVMLVPPAVSAADVRYDRILVPVDGSPSAESVLPMAMRIAEAQDAELLLAHVVPVPELTQIGPVEAEDMDLRERLTARNERVANQYLARLRARVAASGVNARVRVLRDGDVRSRLARLVDEEQVDLVVVSAHGRASRSDVPYGSVAGHLMTHVSVPVLLVRPRVPGTSLRGHPVRYRGDVRLPGRAMS